MVLVSCGCRSLRRVGTPKLCARCQSRPGAGCWPAPPFLDRSKLRIEMKKLRVEARDEPLLKALYRFAPGLRRASDRALSVYMPARPEGFDLRHYDIEIGQLRRRYMDRLDDDEREVMERELMRLRQHLVVVKPAGSPSIAGFADEPAGLLELVNLPVEA